MVHAVTLMCEEIITDSQGRVSLINLMPLVQHHAAFPIDLKLSIWVRVYGLPVGGHVFFFNVTDPAGGYPFGKEDALVVTDEGKPGMIIFRELELRVEQPGALKFSLRIAQTDLELDELLLVGLDGLVAH